MKTSEDVRDFVGGGDRDLQDAEREHFATRIAESTNAYDSWAAGRSLEERFAQDRIATVRSESGETTTVTAPPLAEGATTVPEGFGGAEDSEEFTRVDDDNE